MLLRSVVAVLLSIPATTAVIGLFLALTPAEPTITLSSLLMAFPLWVCVACASYMAPRAGTAAAVLVAVSGAGFGLIALLKFAGMATL